MKLKELKKVIDQFLSDPNNPKYYDMEWRQEYSQEEAENYLYVISTDYITYVLKNEPEVEINKEEIKEMIYKDLEGNIYFKDLMNWLNDNRKSVEWMEQVIVEDQLTRVKEEYLFEDHIRTAQKMQMDLTIPAMIDEFVKMIEKNEDKKENVN